MWFHDPNVPIQRQGNLREVYIVLRQSIIKMCTDYLFLVTTPTTTDVMEEPTSTTANVKEINIGKEQFILLILCLNCVFRRPLLSM